VYEVGKKPRAQNHTRRLSEGPSTRGVRQGAEAGEIVDTDGWAEDKIRGNGTVGTVFCKVDPESEARGKSDSFRQMSHEREALDKAAHCCWGSNGRAGSGARRSTKTSNLRTLRGGGIKAMRGRKKD
jgi:hypothetical protein